MAKPDLKLKWIIHVLFSLAIATAIVLLLFISGASNVILLSSTVGLLVLVSVFNAYALRNYLLSAYSSAAARVRAMSRGALDSASSFSGIREADELNRALDDLVSALRLQAIQIQRLERMRIDFVANASHELKTPLTSIKGYAETLLSGAMKDPTTSQKFLSRIAENTDRLIALTSDLMSLSKLESITQTAEWTHIELKEIERKLDVTFLPTLQQKKQVLTFHFEDSQVEGDREKIEQVLINLIGNAIRYCQQGAHIAVKQSKTSRHWLLEVADNGPGIPKINQDRIFERFYRVDSARSRETGGTGLGLAIVKHIVLLHDGSITLDSDMGKGTRFIIQWPRRTL